MSKTTRRLVFLTCLVALLAIPAEILLLRALSTPDQTTAVREWAQSLSATDRKTETNRLTVYPLVYRRELLRAASPDERAHVWQAHFDAYLQSRPGLDVNTVSLIAALRAMLTPDLFDVPTPEARQQAVDLAQQVANLIGPDDAAFLMHRLGPADGTFASYEPIALRLTNTIRHLFVASAQGGTCDCVPDWGCYSGDETCTGGGICSPGQDWPQCGWLWNEGCTGICLSGW